MAQLRDAIALREETISGDQGRDLNRREEVQPDAGYDDTHRKAGEAANKATEKRGQNEECKKVTIHVLAP